MRHLLQSLLSRFGLEVRSIAPQADLRLMHLVDHTRDFRREDPVVQEFIVFALQRAGRSHAQLFQDLLVEFVLGQRAGTFIEVGAFDGQTLSNTLYLERDLGWTGVLAEPAKVHHAAIRQARPAAKLETRCVFDVTGRQVSFSEMQIGELSTIDGFGGNDHMQRHRKARNTYSVQTVSLDDLVKEHFGERTIDYVSIDTEGTESRILSSYSFIGRPALMTVEHNHAPQRDTIRRLMVDQRGYVPLMQGISCFDDWFVRADVYRQRFAPA
jgi:FkbM family methyltransferase